MAETTNTLYTPDNLLWRFNEAVWAKGTSGVISVKGVYIRQDFPLNDGKYIDKITDEINDVRINIVVSDSIRKVVKDGNVVVIKGYLDRYVDNKDGSIRLQIRVMSADVLEQSSILTAKEIELSGIRHQKMQLGYKPVDTLLSDKVEKGCPRIAMVYPTSSIVHNDFLREMKDKVERYHIEDFRTSFNNEQQLMSTLRAVDNNGFDAVCLVRGGGNDFGVLESPAILKVLTEMGTPTIAAIGHENDKLFINEIVDKYFSTPTSLGGFFKRIVDDVDRKQYQIQQLRESISDGNKTIEELKTKLKRAIWAVVISILLLGATAYCLLRQKAPVTHQGIETTITE